MVLVVAAQSLVSVAALELVHTYCTILGARAALQPSETLYLANLESIQTLINLASLLAQLHQLLVRHVVHVWRARVVHPVELRLLNGAHQHSLFLLFCR
jgi:hypothetical protein